MAPLAPLVLGAAGFLGLNLVDAMKAAGVEPKCGRRRRTNVLALRSRRVEMVTADLDDVDGLVEAMAGCKVVVHAAGYYPRLSLNRESALELGLRQTRNALDAAHRAGVERFVYVSSTATVASARGGASTEADVFGTSPGHGVYHDLKWAMEQVALDEDRFEVVVACPGACLGPWDLRVGTSAIIVATARGLDPPHPDGLVNAVDVRDVAQALLRLTTMEAPPRRILLSGSDQPLQPLLEQLSGRYGVGRPSPAISVEQACALSDAEETRCAEDGGRPALSREIVDLLIHSVPIDTAYAEATLGMCWTPLTATLDAFDDWARRFKIIPPALHQTEPTA